MNWILITPKQINLTEALMSYFEVKIEDLDGVNFPAVKIGRGEYNAAWSNIPGSEGLELEVADSLKHEMTDCFVVYLTNDLHGVYSYKTDQLKKLEVQSINSFLEDLGLDFDDLVDIPIPAKSTVKTVCLIENTTIEEVRRILKINADPGIHLTQNKDNRIQYYSDYGNIAVSVYNLMDKIKGPIYFLHHDPENNRFSCTIMSDGEEIGIFEYPEYETDHIPELKNIDGRSTPREIAIALGIDQHMPALP